MLTICIPIYNQNVTKLISKLAYQRDKSEFLIEIILIDDCSLDLFKKQNESICSKEIYIKLKKNIGRSKIRNLFLKYAKYNNLLFLDCDSTIILNKYIHNYLKFINTNDYDVVFGGSIYNKQTPSRNKRLRWKYGIEQESLPLQTRLQTPNKSFKTNNFLINKKVFEKVKFEERIINYGHEDTLFGYMLKKNNYTITHIENEVLNNDIEDNDEYLEKTEISIRNLISILDYVDNKKELINDITLLQFYYKIKSKKLINYVYFLFSITKPLLKYLLLKGFVSIKLFNFYKLGILITLKFDK